MKTYQQKPRKYQSRLGSLNLVSILKYMTLLEKEQSCNVIFKKSPIRFKAGHLKYLAMLVDQGLLIVRKDYHSRVYQEEIIRTQKMRRKQPLLFYKTTVKGQKLLEMFDFA